MLAVTTAALRTARRNTPQVCRTIAGVRHTSQLRSFHSTRVAYEDPKPTPPPSAHENDTERRETDPAKERDPDEASRTTETESEVADSPPPSTRNGRSSYGSGARRALRNRVPKEVPPVILPNWLNERITLLKASLPIEPSKSNSKISVSHSLQVPTPEDEEDVTIDVPVMPNGVFSTDAEAGLAKCFLIVGMLKDLQTKEGAELKQLQGDIEKICEDLGFDYTYAKGDHQGSLNLTQNSYDQVTKELARIQESQSTKATREVSQNEGYVSGFERRMQDTISTMKLARNVRDAIQYCLVDSDRPRCRSLGDDYRIQSETFEEIVATCRANLTLLPPADVDHKEIPRPDTLLHCPMVIGSRYLDATVKEVASNIGVDLLRLDPDDLAELVGPYLGENLAWTYAQTSLIGYEARKISGKVEDFESSQEIQSSEEDTDDVNHDLGLTDLAGRVQGMLAALDSNGERPRGKIIGISPGTSNQSISLERFIGASASSGNAASSSSTSDGWADLKITAVFEALVDAVTTRRSLSQRKGDVESTAQSVEQPTGLMIHVSEYLELDSVPQGQILLKKLREVVKRRWLAGEQVFIVGTTNGNISGMPLSRATIRQSQADIVRAEYRSIFVPQPRDLSIVRQFEAEETRFVFLTNMRHIENMLKMMGNLDLSNDNAKQPGHHHYDWKLYHRKILDYGHVYRIATTVLGSMTDGERLSMNDVLSIIDKLERSDEIKFASVEQKFVRLTQAKTQLEETAAFEAKRMRTLMSGASKHEKRLLGGIVQPSALHTSFADICVPGTTVEGLKTLTSLSIQRPEAFRYGILAMQKIPGILLYGPPGTGKTMLAKAVAKESGAAVLEVSGSEINDKYVGEGEKNIKALFSLAKKLSPCIIFIDEADAIFGSRDGIDSRKPSHKAIINQFLKELDGMTDFTGMLMVATNRPFDLDDAVLRRLPRRILVDLPAGKDREDILKLHLSSEVLDESVVLNAIANETPLYSGSDLKNLSVAAALACVREENEDAKKHTGPEPYVYPKRRILKKRHFDKAMEEISASISEDMSTLKAIRKFDERYGDRKGRRKKGAGMGFAGSPATEKESEAGRVRKMLVETPA